jgi:hypothetical protein
MKESESGGLQDKTECEAHFEVKAEKRKLRLSSDTKDVQKSRSICCGI